MVTIHLDLDEDELKMLQHWSDRLGVDRDEIIREAIRREVDELETRALLGSVAEPVIDVGALETPSDDWGSTEDWSDWDDAKG